MQPRNRWMLLLLFLGTAACERRDASQPPATAEPSTNIAAESEGSIMRPSVVEETRPDRAEPAQPVRATVYFAFGEAALDEQDRAALAPVIAAARADASVPITVRGYSDTVGDQADNLRMSRKRADAVRDYLVEQKVAEGRIATAALGESPPASANGVDANAIRDKERRVEVVVGGRTAAPALPSGNTVQPAK